MSPAARPHNASPAAGPHSARPAAYLFTGPEELLVLRAAEALLGELRAEGDLDVVDVRAVELKESGLPDLRTGSLFGTPRALLVREAHELPAPVGEALLVELSGAPPPTTVILLASGTGRIQKVARRIGQLGGRVEVAPPREWEERKWLGLVADEFARHGRTAEPAAVQALLAYAGFDVSGIAAKVGQVVAGAGEGKVTAEQVDSLLVGHGSRGSFAVADAMCERDPARALTLLRGVLASGDDPIMVLGALVYRLRSLVAVAGGLDPRAAGLSASPAQLRRLHALRRNFGPGELTTAYGLLAAADREIKGGELPAGFVVERAVALIATPAGR